MDNYARRTVRVLFPAPAVCCSAKRDDPIRSASLGLSMISGLLVQKFAELGLYGIRFPRDACVMV